MDELEIFEQVTNEDGSLDIFLEPPLVEEVDLTSSEDSHYENLVKSLNADDLEIISELVLDGFQADLDSRREWEDMTVEALENLGMNTDESAASYPGGCTATHPLILQNAVAFQSKASKELLPANGPAKTKIMGEKSQEKYDHALRVKKYLNYQLTDIISEYYPETEKMLFLLPVCGNGFKKKYYDPIKKRTCDEYLYPDRVVVNQHAKSMETAERISCITYYTDRELKSLVNSGDFTEPEDGVPPPSKPQTSDLQDAFNNIQGVGQSDSDFDHVHEIIEQQVYLPLDPDTGIYDEDSMEFFPYVVYVDRNTSDVYSIKRNWCSYDEKKLRCEWITHYTFIPALGFYGLGYAHLLGNFQVTLTAIMRSLVDAGEFANMQGGFKDAALRVQNEDANIAPGEWKDVEKPPFGKLEDYFHPVPFKEPSQTLFAMFQLLSEQGQRFADSTEQVVSENSGHERTGAVLALLEASTKFFASVYKRAYFSQKHELKIIGRMNYEFGDDYYPYDDQGFDLREDFNPSTIDIVPVADPNYTSQAQRVAKAQSLVQTAVTDSMGLHDMREVYREFYRAMDVEDIDVFIPASEQAVPQDPVSDISSVIAGKPIKAFPGQDHDSHITVKMSFLQDPQGGANELMAKFGPVIQANIQEHMIEKYKASLGAMAAQQIPVEQASQRLARLNQIAQEEEQKGSPATILAQAEMMKAETDRMEADFDKVIKTLEFVLQSEELRLKAEEQNVKLDLESAKLYLQQFKDLNATGN